MKLNVRRSIAGPYRDVSLTEGATKIEIGLLNDDERDVLARELIEGLYDLSPSSYDESRDWMARMFAAAGVDLPQLIEPEVEA